MHRIFRKCLPFLYERNWYTGQFEFSHHRAVLSVILLLALLLFVIYMVGEMRPIEYSR